LSPADLLQAQFPPKSLHYLLYSRYVRCNAVIANISESIPKAQVLIASASLPSRKLAACVALLRQVD
jgi:hypothetical protein